MSQRFSIFLLLLNLAVVTAFTQPPAGETASIRIGMAGIYVNDPVKAFTFYTDTLGFDEYMFYPDMGLAIVSSPKDRDGAVLLLEPNDHPVARNYQAELYGAGVPVIVFMTDDIHAEYERLSAMGVAFTGAPVKTPFGIETVFDDRQGNWIKLHEMPAEEE